MLAVGINKVHYTTEGIKEQWTFSVNIPSAEMIEKTDYCGIVSGKKEPKSDLFKVFYGHLKNAPMIEDCPLCMECRLAETVDLPTNYLFIGEIVAAFAKENCLHEGRPDIEKINPLMLTMPDNRYWTVGPTAGYAWEIGKGLKDIGKR